MNVGNRLKQLLERERTTAYRVCKDLGLDEGQLSRFLRKGTAMSVGRIEQIADYLGYDVEFVKRRNSRKGGKLIGNNLQATRIKKVLDKVP